MKPVVSDHATEPGVDFLTLLIVLPTSCKYNSVYCVLCTGQWVHNKHHLKETLRELDCQRPFLKLEPSWPTALIFLTVNLTASKKRLRGMRAASEIIRIQLQPNPKSALRTPTPRYIQRDSEDHAEWAPLEYSTIPKPRRPQPRSKFKPEPTWA